MNKLQQAQDTIEFVRSKTDEVILFNSFGKDSLVVMDLIAPYFRRVVCVFMYFVPDLDHINRFIGNATAKYSNMELVQVPHWNLSYIRKGGMYCTPDPKQRLKKLADVVWEMREKYGIEYCFLGMKKADGMNRRMMLNTYAENHYVNKGMCYPLAEWTQKEVLAYMRMHRLPTPVRYGKDASNGVGFNTDCFVWLEKNAPQDLQTIYKYFPHSERILFEYYYKQQQ